LGPAAFFTRSISMNATDLRTSGSAARDNARLLVRAAERLLNLTDEAVLLAGADVNHRCYTDSRLPHVDEALKRLSAATRGAADAVETAHGEATAACAGVLGDSPEAAA